MPRDLYINGESMVQVKGSAANSDIATLKELGLAEGPIRVSFGIKHMDVMIDAWGAGEVPFEVQQKLSDATITMTLIHFDQVILRACLAESMAGAFGSFDGVMPRTGTRMGGGAARFAATNHFIGLNITSPIAGLPYRFLFAYMTGNPLEWPLGTERSQVQVTWRAIPYAVDPYGGNSAGNTYGTGSAGALLYDRTLDS